MAETCPICKHPKPHMMVVTLTPLMQVCATFRPRRREDIRLKPGVEDWVGWQGIWEASWLIEEGPLAEEWHMTAIAPNPLPFIWCPSGDLDMHHIVEA